MNVNKVQRPHRRQVLNSQLRPIPTRIQSTRPSNHKRTLSQHISSTRANRIIFNTTTRRRLRTRTSPRRQGNGTKRHLNRSNHGRPHRHQSHQSSPKRSSITHANRFTQHTHSTRQRINTHRDHRRKTRIHSPTISRNSINRDAPLILNDSTPSQQDTVHDTHTITLGRTSAV